MRLKIQTYLCEIVVNNNSLRKHYLIFRLYFPKAIFRVKINLNPKGIMFPYDDKHFILLTSVGNNNP